MICLSQFPCALVWWVGSKSCKKVILLDNLTALCLTDYVTENVTWYCWVKGRSKVFNIIGWPNLCQILVWNVCLHYAGVVWMNKLLALVHTVKCNLNFGLGPQDWLISFIGIGFELFFVVVLKFELINAAFSYFSSRGLCIWSITSRFQNCSFSIIWLFSCKISYIYLSWKPVVEPRSQQS